MDLTLALEDRKSNATSARAAETPLGETSQSPLVLSPTDSNESTCDMSLFGHLRPHGEVADSGHSVVLSAHSDHSGCRLTAKGD